MHMTTFLDYYAVKTTDRGMQRLSVSMLLIVGTYAAKDLVWWNLTTHPVIFGQKMTLKCSVQEHACNHESTRKWTRGTNVKTVLCVNGKSMNDQKFIMVTYINSLDFDLIVSNVEHSDLNESYLCSCGFNSHEDSLQLEGLSFIYPPMEANVEDYSCKQEAELYINFTVLEVYPVPDCSIGLNEVILIDKVNFSYQSIMQSVMYLISYTAAYKSIVNKNDALLNIVCLVESTKVYQLSKELQPCEQLKIAAGQENHPNSIYDVWIIVSITLVVGVLLLLILWKIRRKKQNGNHEFRLIMTNRGTDDHNLEEKNTKDVHIQKN